MADSHEDDLFKNTSMTFGEHLEELRASLFKAVLCLLAGFCIGLWFAPQIVQAIQSPLENALEKFYSDEALDYVNSRLPDDLKNNEAAQKLVLEDKLVPQEVFVAPGAMLSELQKNYPEQFADVKLPEVKQPDAAANPEAAKSEGAKTEDAAATRLSKNNLVRMFLWRPMSDDERLKVKNFNVQESFMIYIKAAFLFGAVVSSPFVFYFLWSFVAAGLYPHEKKYVHLFLPASVGLFLAGAALAFFFVFPPVLTFFFGITKSMGQGLEPRISEWLSFVLLLPLGFGVSFQLPLLMLFLERIHVFTVGLYLAKWRIAVLLMAIASMVLSPGGDPYSMLMMLVPLICLYFGGIALCKWLPSDRGRPSDVSERTYAGVD